MLKKKIGAIHHICIQRMNRVALLGVSNEKKKNKTAAQKANHKCSLSSFSEAVNKELHRP